MLLPALRSWTLPLSVPSVLSISPLEGFKKGPDLCTYLTPRGLPPLPSHP